MRDIHTMSSEDHQAALAAWDKCSEFDLGWDSPAMVAI